MAKQFHELRERLLQAGVAPRHVRRYVNELADHLTDLRTEEERSGRNPEAAKSAAVKRLGEMDALAQAMIERRNVKAWSARAPWAVFSVAPVALLAAAYFIALFILWSGWKLFLPGTTAPFVQVDGFSMLYFGVGRLIYFSAPILIGWGIGFIAVRQRLSPRWPAVGWVLMAWIGGSANVRASRDSVEHISLHFSLAPTLHALVILFVAALPLLIWRLQKTAILSA
jgi:hypothetical protein